MVLAAAAALAAWPAGGAAGSDREGVAAACTTVSYGGDTYILSRKGVGCAFARKWVRRLHNSGRGPSGWKCSSGSNYETGGFCRRSAKSFRWHPGD